MPSSSKQDMMKPYESLPEREYYVAPKSRRKRRRGLRAVPLLLCLLLFVGGFLLGRVSALEPQSPAAAGAAAAAMARAGAVHILAPESAGATPPSVPAGPDRSAWNLVLINGSHPLAEDFSAPELTALNNGQRIDSRVFPELQAMMDAARAEGLDPLICSSFRTWDKQEQLYERKVRFYRSQGLGRSQAEEQAAMWVARPGTSEHQAGLAVDIVSKGYQVLDEKQEETAVQQWLMEHCAEYGFILRYPTDKSELTGVGYEPWHYRYVGREAAREITEQGICLEEYLET